jgi:hypothetical protein
MKETVVSVVLFCLTLSACNTGSTDARPAASVTSYGGPGGTRIVELSVAPVIAVFPNARPIEPDLVLGLDEPVVFGSAVDVAAAGDGRFAVLDRMERQVTVHAPGGDRMATFGRRGEGPGEFAFPVALEWLESGEIVVWDVSPTKTFTSFAPTGEVIITAEMPVPGDWFRLSFRHPTISRDGSQMGPEEVTRRLRKSTGASFVHLIQDNELSLAELDPLASTIVPQASLIRYSADLTLLDTLAVMPGIPYVSRRDLEIPGIARQFEQALFAAQPVWAVGRDWIAVGHGDSTSILVSDYDGRRHLEIRWPRATMPVSDEDKLAAADWILRIRIENFSESRRMYEHASRRERREARYGTAFALTRFAEHLPQLTGLYSVGRCLLIAGFSAIDHHDGHSQILMVIDVDSGELEDVIRLGAPGARIKAFDTRAAYGLRRGRDGVSLVERYPLPDLRCSADPGADQPKRGKG